MGLSNTSSEYKVRCDKWNTVCMNDVCTTTCEDYSYDSDSNKLYSVGVTAIPSDISVCKSNQACVTIDIDNISTSDGIPVTEYIENVVKKELESKLNPQPHFKVLEPRKSDDIDISELMMLI